MNNDQQSPLDINSENTQGTPQDTTDNTPDDTIRKWFVAVVNNKSEKTVSKQLAAIKDVESFVPLTLKETIWKNGRKHQTEIPLISARVFVRCTEKKRLDEVVKLDCISRFMVDNSLKNTSSRVMVIPDDDMDTFREAIIRTNGEITIWESTFTKGDMVRIIDGPLKGLVGYINRDGNSGSKFIIKIGTFGYGVFGVKRNDFKKIPKNKIEKEKKDLQQLNEVLKKQDPRLQYIQRKIEEKEKIKNHTRK